MTIVNEARGALQNSASAVLSTVRRRQKASRRLMPINTRRLSKQMKQQVKQLNRRFMARRTRRVSALPIVLAVSGAVVGTATAIVVRRYLATRATTPEASAVPEEAVLVG